MTFDSLKNKATGLPLSPGVYIMKDKSGQVIYVGKAKKLKNRVSQYFQDTASHTPKTKLMVSKIDSFDVIVASSEFEALVLECSLIKRHMPKYNILLKDDKGYPYLRLNMKDAFPAITLVSKVADDGAAYYGPFGSRGVTQSVMKAIVHSLQLPDCAKQFPRDLGKGRVCLNYHMGQCAGWCQMANCQAEYYGRMEQAKDLLSGNFKQVFQSIREEMLSASDALNFELAAALRNRLKAIEALSQKQLVTAGKVADTDVIGYACTQAKACFTVLHFSEGNLLDKDYEVLPVPEDENGAVSSLLKQYYLSKGYAPKEILLPFAVDDSSLFAQLLEQKFGRRVRIAFPQRGDKVRLLELAVKNAEEEAQRLTTKEEHLNGAITQLGKLLGIAPPKRIESYDISNISGTDIVGSMVVFQDGKPRKSDYKRFKLKDMQDQDDYGAMRQVLERRFSHLQDEGSSFSICPDLLLIDGGAKHAAVAHQVLEANKLSIPIFGMVKDDRHRTRALVTADNSVIHIDTNPALFSLIGNIQEQTHNFAITYHRSLRSKRLRHSALDAIAGIGQIRKQALLKHFSSIKAISQASILDLEQVLPHQAAIAVYRHFHSED